MTLRKIVFGIFGAIALGIVLTIALALSNRGDSGESVYTGKTAGLFEFGADKIHVEAFNDPDIPGIRCHMNLPDRAWSFDDQTDIVISCAQVGPVTAEQLSTKPHVFKQGKGLFFKQMRIDRIYQAEYGTLYYFGYTTKVEGDNAASGGSLLRVDLDWNMKPHPVPVETLEK